MSKPGAYIAHNANQQSVALLFENFNGKVISSSPILNVGDISCVVTAGLQRTVAADEKTQTFSTGFYI